MLTDLLIVGAGGSSREIADAVRDINRQQPRWNLLGFLDDDPAKQGILIDGAPVVGPLPSVAAYTAQVIIGIANSRNLGVRRLIVEQLSLPPERYATIVHSSASVSPHTSIGVGTAVLQNVVITPGTAIGSHVLISQNVTMAHDQVVEDFVIIASGVTITGFVRLRAGSYIGAGAVINNGITVNEEALVGIGSVVLQDVPARRTVFGNPARLVPELRRH
jgi:sugar O-acyltransferase (sialic acid O-acetyltransferase NeuD family)